MMPRTIKKSTPRWILRADLRHNAVNALPTLQIPSPSLVGQTVTVGRAVLPAQVHSSSAPSQSNSFSGSIERRAFLQIRSPIRWRDRAGNAPASLLNPCGYPTRAVQAVHHARCCVHRSLCTFYIIRAYYNIDFILVKCCAHE